jgi:putative oxidoreductase
MLCNNRIAGLVTAARLTFAAVLLPWFWITAVSKLAGHTLSVGPAAGPWPLSLGAFHAFVPRLMQDGQAPGAVAVAYVWVMTLAELVLPPMVAAGLLARWSAALLIVQMALGWGLLSQAGGRGALFDPSPYDAVPDQLLLWSGLLLPVALFGAGPLSLDALVARRRRSSRKVL